MERKGKWNELSRLKCNKAAGNENKKRVWDWWVGLSSTYIFRVRLARDWGVGLQCKRHSTKRFINNCKLVSIHDRHSNVSLRSCTAWQRIYIRTHTHIYTHVFTNIYMYICEHMRMSTVELNSPNHWAKQNHWNCHCLSTSRERETKSDDDDDICIGVRYLYEWDWGLCPSNTTVIGIYQTHKLGV